MKKNIVALLFAAALSNSQAAVATYKVDPVHSYVVMKILHGGVSNNYGTFGDIAGVVKFDDADPTKSSVEFTIKADTINTNNAKRDQHLKSPDFLNAKQFPVITFKSTAVKKLDDKNYEITGDLALRGTTKSLTTKFNIIGFGKNYEGVDTAGGETVFTIKRSEFGSTYGNNGGVGDDVTVTVAVEGVKEK
jgi:polyisoprenoid-binding protein YceI